LGYEGTGGDFLQKKEFYANPKRSGGWHIRRRRNNVQPANEAKGGVQ